MSEYSQAVMDAVQKGIEEDVTRVRAEVQAKFRETGALPPDFAVAKWLEVIALLSVPARMRKRAKAANVRQQER